MSPFVLWGVQALVVMMKAKESGADKVLKQQIDDLREQFKPMLPAPPNGVEWTMSDLEGYLADLMATNQQIRDVARRR